MQFTGTRRGACALRCDGRPRTGPTRRRGNLRGSASIEQCVLWCLLAGAAFALTSEVSGQLGTGLAFLSGFRCLADPGASCSISEPHRESQSPLLPYRGYLETPDDRADNSRSEGNASSTVPVEHGANPFSDRMAELYKTSTHYSGQYGDFLVGEAGSEDSFAARSYEVQVAGGPLVVAPLATGFDTDLATGGTDSWTARVGSRYRPHGEFKPARMSAERAVTRSSTIPPSQVPPPIHAVWKPLTALWRLTLGGLLTALFISELDDVDQEIEEWEAWVGTTSLDLPGGTVRFKWSLDDGRDCILLYDKSNRRDVCRAPDSDYYVSDVTGEIVAGTGPMGPALLFPALEEEAKNLQANRPWTDWRRWWDLLRGVGTAAEQDVAVDSAASKPQLPPNERGQEVSREELPDGRISIVRRLPNGQLVEEVIENRTGVAVRRLSAKERKTHERARQLARQYKLRAEAFRIAEDYAKQLADQGEVVDLDHPVRSHLPASARIVELSHPAFDSTRPYLYSSLLEDGADAITYLPSEDFRQPPDAIVLNAATLGLAATGAYRGVVDHEASHYDQWASLANHVAGSAPADVESPYHVWIFDDEGNRAIADEVRAMVARAEHSRTRFDEVSRRPIEELVQEYQTGELGDWVVPFIVMNTKDYMEEAEQLGQGQRGVIDRFLYDDMELQFFDVRELGPWLEVRAVFRGQLYGTVHIPAVLVPAGKERKRADWVREYLGRAEAQIRRDEKQAKSEWTKFERRRFKFARDLAEAIDAAD